MTDKALRSKISAVGVPGASHESIGARRQLPLDSETEQLRVGLLGRPEDAGIEPAPQVTILAGDDLVIQIKQLEEGAVFMADRARDRPGQFEYERVRSRYRVRSLVAEQNQLAIKSRQQPIAGG